MPVFCSRGGFVIVELVIRVPLLDGKYMTAVVIFHIAMTACVPHYVWMCYFAGANENSAWLLLFVTGKHGAAARLCAQPHRSLEGLIPQRARI